MMRRPRGWRNHSYEHALAARGIRTRNQKQKLKAEGVIKDIVQFPDGVKISYGIPRQVFSLFWVSSLEGDFSNFDFDQAFDVAEIYIAEQGRTYGGIRKVGSFKVCTGKIGTDEVRFSKVGSPEVRPTQINTIEICVDKLGILQNCPADICLA